MRSDTIRRELVVASREVEQLRKTLEKLGTGRVLSHRSLHEYNDELATRVPMTYVLIACSDAHLDALFNTTSLTLYEYARF